MTPDDWAKLAYAFITLLLMLVGVKGGQTQERKRQTEESRAAARLRKLDDEWRSQVDHDLFGSTGKVRLGFHMNDQVVNDHENRLRLLESDKKHTEVELAEIKEKIDELNPKVIETHILVKQLMAMSDRRGRDRD